MNITVILCTFNRCSSLSKTLASIARTRLSEPAQWEVLIVDNNSTDQTQTVVDQYRQQFPDHFRYCFEPHPGKSYALNTGIRESRGDVLVFTDDDVIVTPTWMENLTQALQTHEWAGVAGPIILQWPENLPRWLATEGPDARHPFPGLDHGRIACPMPGPPFGANMAFRKDVLLACGGFRTDLGPSPNRDIPPHSEDTELGRRVMANGDRLYYEPLAVVYHPVAAERINRKYFLDWWFDIGRAEVRIYGPANGVTCHGVPLLVIAQFIVWVIRWLTATRPTYRYYSQAVAWQKAGQLKEAFHSTRLREEDGKRRISPHKPTWKKLL